MDDRQNCLMNAEIAFNNKQYNTALEWYQKVLAITPDDLYVLSRAGAICVPLGRFEEALTHFGHAYELDPANGDNAFNYANACFFNKDNVKAFEMYVEAEKAGCSDDVKPRLYYQLALVCSMRNDVDSALIYLQKCETSDRTGIISLNPDLISEKLKLYMLQKDFVRAEKCAAQLVAINPKDFRSYMVYFSILMGHNRHDAALTLLADARRYAELTDENSFALSMQEAALFTAMADAKPDQQAVYCEKAITLLKNCRIANREQQGQVLLAMAETYCKMESYDEAIQLLLSMLDTSAKASEEPAAVTAVMEDLTEDELDEMAQRDMDMIQEKIDCGELDDDLGLDAETEFDDDGEEYHIYAPDTFTFASADVEKTPEEPQPSRQPEFSAELQEKAVFTLLTCYLAKDDFRKAALRAKQLKQSSNKYYQYYGLYTEALTERKVSGDTDGTRRKYTEAIAFFRSRTLKDSTDTLAVLFRARLYAEQGQYEKATEISHLLAEADRNTLLAYISQCKGGV